MFDIIVVYWGNINVKKDDLPNKLTMLRIILVPFFIVAMALPTEWTWTLWTAFGIFVVAAITDFLDGQISRRKKFSYKIWKDYGSSCR